MIGTIPKRPDPGMIRVPPSWDSSRLGQAMHMANRRNHWVNARPDTGALAPEIVLPAGPGHSWDLRDLRGKSVVLVFYPSDWEPVSTDQLAHYNGIVPQLQALDAELVGISVDGIWCHQAFAKALGLRFRLLSDAYPRGAAARAYGVYRSRDGTCERALVVIDPKGIIRWRYVAPREISPGIDGMLTALEALARGTETA
jgi:peroxiredoxin